MKRVVLPSITTAGQAYRTWRTAIEDLSLLGINECALFLTGLGLEERAEIYSLLAEVARIQPLRIPFVHARSDMAPEEYEFLSDTFGTRLFNLHPVREMPLSHSLPASLRQRVYIENTTSLRARDLLGFAGMCTDISHLEDHRRKMQFEICNQISSLATLHPVGASHVSPITRQPYVFKDGSITYAPHHSNGVHEFNYLRVHPRALFGAYIAIEVDNPLEEQLAIKRHIEQNVLRLRVTLPAWEPVTSDIAVAA